MANKHMESAQRHSSLGKFRSELKGDTTAHSLGCSERLKITNAGEDGPPTLLVGMQASMAISHISVRESSIEASENL